MTRLSAGPGDNLDEPIHPLRRALEAAQVVGTWDWDLVRDSVVYDAGAAALLTRNAALANRELNDFTRVATVHPSDQVLVLEGFHRAADASGTILVKFRIIAEDDSVRWLLSRGRTFRDESGRPVRSSGIFMDITEIYDDRTLSEIIDGASQGDLIGRAVELAVALKRTLDRTDKTELRLAADILLHGLGRAMAPVSRSH